MGQGQAANWQPTSSLAVLQYRAKLYQQIRSFFHQRGIWEVETPLAAPLAANDLHLISVELGSLLPSQQHQYFLSTSPEGFMKRLLAAGSGAIYQISKVFRRDELGRLHHPEFTMLEWYRPGFNHRQLMEEVDQLIMAVLGTKHAQCVTYRQLYLDELALDPFTASTVTLGRALQENTLESSLSRSQILDLHMSQMGTKLGFSEPVFVTDYPAEEAQQARLTKDDQGLVVAERFELYINGVEIANGYHELCDAKEMRQRFEQQYQKRKALGLKCYPIDQALLAACDAGLPPCAGVALGIDRLIMVAKNCQKLSQVMSFGYN